MSQFQASYCRVLPTFVSSCDAPLVPLQASLVPPLVLTNKLMGKAKGGNKAAVAQSQATSSNESSVRWPELPYAGRELDFEVLIPDQVLLLPELFTSKDCARWTSFLSSSLSLEPSPPVPKKGEAVRSNERFSIHDEKLAASLFLLLEPYLPQLASRPPGATAKALSQ